jgi:hypothetical protein
MRPQRFTAFQGGADQELRGQQEVAVLAGTRVSSAGQVRTDDAGPVVKRAAGLGQQFPGPQHPGMRRHKAAQSLPGKRLTGPFSPTGAGRPAPCQHP